MGQNYHLIHHLWPAIPWYRYQPAYYATQHILDAKGSPQCLGILQSSKDFWSFVYDAFVGIRLSHPRSLSPGQDEQPDSEVLRQTNLFGSPSLSSARQQLEVSERDLEALVRSVTVHQPQRHKSRTVSPQPVENALR